MSATNTNIVKMFTDPLSSDRANQKLEKIVSEAYNHIKSKTEGDERYIERVLLSLLTMFCARVLENHDRCDKCDKQDLMEGITIVREMHENLEKVNRGPIRSQLKYIMENYYEVLQEAKIPMPSTI